MMKLPFSWIKDHLEIDATPQAVGDILTSLGLEVDAIYKEDLPFSGVVVGQIESVEPHPNADKLVLLKVSDGTTLNQVVCGAKNCRVGVKYPFAKEGAELKEESGPFVLKRTKIRGVESQGMLCSAVELQVADNDDGILELGDDAPLGENFASLIQDDIFEISLTPNMGHNFCLMGVVRELSASTGIPFKETEAIVRESEEPIENAVDVEILEKKGCQRYAARLIRNVAVGKSPVWLKRRLQACGIRSINNIVDILNYVMLERGQPMHAFDFDKVKNGKIIVRNAINGEKLVTIDGKERVLREDHLIIADSEKPLAIAGVMGGLDSSVTDTTTTVLLESAYFDPSYVRKSSKQCALSTDASKRFERGVDYEGVVKAINRAAMLIEEVCGAKPLKGVLDKGRGHFEPKVVHCRLSRIEEILGMHLGLDEVETILTRLLFGYKWDGKNSFSITVPSYRHDINQEIDIIEEIVRIYGYDNIPRKMEKYVGSQIGHAPIYLLEREMKNRLVASGLQEFMTCDLLSKERAEMITPFSGSESSLISVLNPISIEHCVLRPSLIPGLLGVIKHNADFQNRDIAGFEVGRIHYKVGEQYKEQTTAALILTGKKRAHHWDGHDRDVDFFDLKGIVENIFNEMSVGPVQFIPSDFPLFHTGRRAKIVVEGVELGVMGEIHPDVMRKLDISSRIYIAEWNLHELHRLRKTAIKMKPLALYPASDRDWTVTLKESIPSQQLVDLIRSVQSPYLEEVTLKDIYRSDKLGEKKKNVTIHFVYRDRTKTLSQEAVDLEHARVTQNALESISNLGFKN